MTFGDLASADFFSDEILGDPHPYYAVVRERHPVLATRVRGHDRPAFLITSYPLVREVFADADRFSSQFVEVMMQGAEPNPEADALFEQGVKQASLLLNLDEPEHQRYRTIASTVFTPRLAHDLTAKMERTIDAVIDGVIRRGECDFVAEIAAPYMVRVICDLLGYDESVVPDLRRWSDALITRVSQAQSKEDDIAAVRQIIEYQAFNKQIIAERRANPRDDIISHIVHARVGGIAPLTDREALILIQEIGGAGNETARATLTGGFARLIQEPELRARLEADPALIPGAADEMVRLVSAAAGIWRITRHDTELGGVAIPAGAILMLRMDSANRDPTVFADPDRLDPERRNRSTHVGFGYGIHFCIGHMLAKREVAVAIGRLIERLRNPRIVPEKTDLRRHPSVLSAVPRALHITFDPA